MTSRVYLPVLVFVATAAVYHAMPQPTNPNAGDNLWYVPTAISIVRHHTQDLTSFGTAIRAADPNRVWIDCIDVDPRLIAIQGSQGAIERVNQFPIGPTLFAIPIVAVTDVVWGRDSEPPFQRAERLAVLAAAISAAIAAALMFMLVDLLSERRWIGWVVTLIYALATPHFGTHHSELWSHNVLQMFVIAALILVVIRDGAFSWLGAIPIALAYATRPDSALFVGLYAVLVLITSRRRTAFLLVGLASASVFAWWSRATFGTTLPPYYSGLQATHFALYPEALAGVLVSPSRGVLVYSPIVLLAIPGALATMRRPLAGRGIYVLSSAVIVGYWLMLGALPWWGGGFSVGPRYFTPILPFIVVLMVPAIEWVSRLRRAPQRAAVAAIAVTLLWSTYVEFRMGLSSGPYEWNYEPNVNLHPEQLWNWRDMQIFRRPSPTGIPPLPRIPSCPSIDTRT